MIHPSVSIITVNLNNGSGLEKTICSVIEQNYTPLEYIVIDGNSTDNSKSVIEQYRQNIDIAVSEKDNGIYHAMNKGIANAKGDYLLFLNSGDTLINNNAVKLLIENGNNADLIYGDIVIVASGSKRTGIFPDELSFKFFYINSLPHPCTLIKKELFKKVGLYREDFKIAADWAFFVLAVCKYHCSYKHVNSSIAEFHLGGVSTTQEDVIQKERELILNEYFPAFKNDYRDLFYLDNELHKVRKLLGYRIHNKLNKLFKGNDE